MNEAFTKVNVRPLIADVPVRIKRLMWRALVLALCGVPLLVSHQTENTVWRPQLHPNTFILNTGKIELLLVDAALIAVVLSMLGLAISSTDWRKDFFVNARQIVTELGGFWWVLLAGWAFISVLWSVEPQLTLYRSSHLVLTLVMALAAAHAVRQGYGKWMLAALIVAALVQSSLAVAQYINDAPLGLTWLEEIQVPPNSPFGAESTRLRAYGLTLHPNILAGFLMISALICMLVAKSSSWYVALPAASVGILAIMAIVTTSSRLVLVVTMGAIFLAGFLLMFSRSRMSLLKMGGLALIAVVAIGVGAFVLQQAFPDTWGRFEELRDLEGIENRVTFGFSNTVPLIEENPVLGVGNGASVMAFGREWEGSRQLLLPAHNTYIHIWSELGLIGVFLFIASLMSLLRLMHSKNGQPTLMLGIAIISIMIVMGFDYYFWGEPRSQVLLFWLAGMMWGYVHLGQSADDQDDPWTPKPDYYPMSRKHLLAEELHRFRQNAQHAGISSKESHSVTVQIVTFNNAETIDLCLESVLAQTYTRMDIIVVDNGSTDATANYVERSGIQTIQNPRNLGYSAAHNQAFAESNSKYVLTLNPDAWIAPDYIDTLVDYLEAHPIVGLASGLLLRVDRLGDQPETVDGAGLMMQRSRRQRLRYEGLRAESAPQGITPIFGPDGAAAFYRRSMLKDVAIDGEVFDEDFFLHKEDVDLCWRAQLLGWDAVCVPDAVAHHIRTFRPGERTRKQVSQDLRVWAVRNRYLKLIKNADWSNMLNDLPFFLGYEASILGYLVLREHQSLPAYSAVGHAVRRMMYKRNRIQSRRRRSANQMRQVMRLGKP